MDFAGGAIDDLGGGAQIDAHGQHSALTDLHAFRHFGAGTDEGAIADDHRAGL